MKLVRFLAVYVGFALLPSCKQEEAVSVYVINESAVSTLKYTIDSCYNAKTYEAYITNQLSLADIYRKSDSLAAWLFCYDRIIKISRDNLSLETAINYYKAMHDGIWRVPVDSASKNNLAWIHRQIAYEFGPKLQKWQLCIPYYLEGIKLIASSDSWTSDKAIKFLKPCGSAYTRVGEPQNAIGYLKQCYAICEEEQDTLNMLKSLNDLGIAFYDIAKFPEALETYHLARSLNSNGKHIEEYRGTLSKLTTYYIDTKQIDSASQYINLLQLSMQHNKVELDDIADFNTQQAHYYELTNNTNLAVTHFHKAIQLFLQSPENRGREAAKVWVDLGNMFLQVSKYEDAIEAFQQALKIMIPSYNVPFGSPINSTYLYPENIIMEALSGQGDAFYNTYLQTNNNKDINIAVQLYETAFQTRNLLLNSYELQSSRIKFEKKTQHIPTRLAEAKRIVDLD